MEFSSMMESLSRTVSLRLYGMPKDIVLQDLNSHLWREECSVHSERVQCSHFSEPLILSEVLREGLVGGSLSPQ